MRGVLAPMQLDSRDKIATIDDLAQVVEAYRNAQAEADRWKKAAEVLKARIQQAMGDATVATVAGQPVATWRPTGQFQETKFRNEQPDLARHYVKTVEVIDTERLAADHPDLYTAYRARRFVRVQP